VNVAGCWCVRVRDRCCWVRAMVRAMVRCWWVRAMVRCWLVRVRVRCCYMLCWWSVWLC